MATTIEEQEIPIEKHKIIDERLKNVNIPTGLIDALNNAGFTIDIILNSHPSDIAQILDIDDYVAQIIYQETKYYCYQTNESDNEKIPMII